MVSPADSRRPQGITVDEHRWDDLVPSGSGAYPFRRRPVFPDVDLGDRDACAAQAAVQCAAVRAAGAPVELDPRVERGALAGVFGVVISLAERHICQFAGWVLRRTAHRVPAVTRPKSRCPIRLCMVVVLISNSGIPRRSGISGKAPSTHQITPYAAPAMSSAPGCRWRQRTRTRRRDRPK